jgi:hypothetical protein
MVLEDDSDEEMQLLTGGPGGPGLGTSAAAVTRGPGFVPSLAQLAMLHPSTGQPIPSSHGTAQHQQQQQTPAGFVFGSSSTGAGGVTPSSDTAMAMSATPNFDHLLRPAYQQPFQLPPGLTAAESAAAASWITPPSAHVAGAPPGSQPGIGGRGLAAALFATPGDITPGSSSTPAAAGAAAAAAASGGRGGRGGRGGGTGRGSSRAQHPINFPGGRPTAPRGSGHAAGQGTGSSHNEGGLWEVNDSDIAHVMACTGAERATAIAALSAANGDLVRAADQVVAWRRGQV